MITPKAIQNWQKKWRRSVAIRKFEENTLGNVSFYTLIFAGGVIGSAGLIQGNEAVVIGAMLITPLVTPLSGIALGLTMQNTQTLSWAVVRSFLGISLLFVLSYIIGEYFWDGVTNQSLDARSNDRNILDVFIAIAAGIVAALALASEKIHSHLSGAAIALSLAPPLSVAALWLAKGNFNAFYNASTLFLLNVGGIISMGIVIFIIFGFRRDNAEA